MHRIVVGILVGILMLTLAPIASAVTDRQFNALKRKVNALQGQLNALHAEVDEGFGCLEEVTPMVLLGAPPTEGYVYGVQGQGEFLLPAFTLDVRTTHDDFTYWVQLADPACIENARIVAKPAKTVSHDLLRAFAR